MRFGCDTIRDLVPDTCSGIDQFDSTLNQGRLEIVAILICCMPQARQKCLAGCHVIRLGVMKSIQDGGSRHFLEVIVEGGRWATGTDKLSREDILPTSNFHCSTGIRCMILDNTTKGPGHERADWDRNGFKPLFKLTWLSPSGPIAELESREPFGTILKVQRDVHVKACRQMHDKIIDDLNKSVWRSTWMVS